MNINKGPELRSQQMQIGSHPGKRPVTLSPTYRYKQDGQQEKSRRVLQASQPKTGDESNNLEATLEVQQRKATFKDQSKNFVQAKPVVSEMAILPAQGGSTPTSMLQNQLTNISTLSRHLNNTAEVSFNQFSTESNKGEQKPFQGGANAPTVTASVTLRNIQNPPSGSSYKVPVKLTNSVTGGLPGHSQVVNPIAGALYGPSQSQYLQMAQLKPHARQSFHNHKQQLEQSGQQRQIRVYQPDPPHGSKALIMTEGLPKISESRLTQQSSNQANGSQYKSKSLASHHLAYRDQQKKGIPNTYENHAIKNNRSTSEFNPKQQKQDGQNLGSFHLGTPLNHTQKHGTHAGTHNKVLIQKYSLNYRNADEQPYTQPEGMQVNAANNGLVSTTRSIPKSHGKAQSPTFKQLRRSGESQLLPLGNTIPKNLQTQMAFVKALPTAHQKEEQHQIQLDMDNPQFQGSIENTQALLSGKKYLFNQTVAYPSQLQFLAQTNSPDRNNELQAFNQAIKDVTLMAPFKNLRSFPNSSNTTTLAANTQNFNLNSNQNLQNQGQNFASGFKGMPISSKLSHFHQKIAGASKQKISPQPQLSQLTHELTGQRSSVFRTEMNQQTSGHVEGVPVHGTPFYTENGPIMAVKENLTAQSQNWRPTGTSNQFPTNEASSEMASYLRDQSQGKDISNHQILTENSAGAALSETTNSTKIKKFLHLIDLQDLVERETQNRLNISEHRPDRGVRELTPTRYVQKQKVMIKNKNPKHAHEIISTLNSQPQSATLQAMQATTNAANKVLQSRTSQYSAGQKNKLDPNIWKHFQNLLQYDLSDDSLQQQLTQSQKKTLVSLRQQILKKGFQGINSEEICQTVKQFIESCNMDELEAAPERFNGQTTSPGFNQGNVLQTQYFGQTMQPTMTASAGQRLNSMTPNEGPAAVGQTQAYRQNLVSFGPSRDQASPKELNTAPPSQQANYSEAAHTLSPRQTSSQHNQESRAKQNHDQNSRMGRNMSQSATKKATGQPNANEHPHPQHGPPPPGGPPNAFPQRGFGTGFGQFQPKVININKLNINIQQFTNSQGAHTIHPSGLQGTAYQFNNQFHNSRNAFNLKQGSQVSSSGAGASSQQPGQNLPKQIQDTLFIMDCQLLGLLKHQNLLNLDTGKQMPLSQDRDIHLSEAELVHFFMTRANSAMTLMFKELPKLSEEAKQIINMIKAQRQVDIQDEIPKVETLVIEMEYVDYKNKLLQALFNNYGDAVLETIIHKIQQRSSEQETVRALNAEHFQTIGHYVDGIRRLHQESSKTEFQAEMEKRGIAHQVIAKTERSASESQVDFSHGEELRENLAYLFPNQYDPARQTLNFEPSFRGKRHKDRKVNFGVIVKETKLYHALRQADQLQREHPGSTGGLRAADLSPKESSKRSPSSFLVTHDCTLLRFMLFCSHAGIIRSAQASLRLFFKNVFIVIKPGSQPIAATAATIHHTELPRVDVEKVTNYIQNQLKKKQKSMENYIHLKRFQSLTQSSGAAHEREPKGAQKAQAQAAIHKGLNAAALGGAGPGTALDRNKSTVSLTSYKSLRQIEQARIGLASHFNSLQSSIRAEFAPTQLTTIKIYHKPYTHLNQSRIQKAFKIYNEFVQLTFKNKLIYAQAGEGMNQDMQDFSQAQASRICKLGSQMGIKDLPKKHSLLRAPLLELFRNHRQLSRVKEQILRFIYRALNEENNISSSFSSIVLAGNAFLIDRSSLKVVKEAEAQNAAGSGQNNKVDPSLQTGTGGQLQSTKSVVQVPAQKNQAYKYQVGYGNNHLLIKSIMKNRRWWQQATARDVAPNFDDAHILWTQWCKKKLCNHLITSDAFNLEFRDTLRKIEDRGNIKASEGAQANQSPSKLEQLHGHGKDKHLAKSANKQGKRAQMLVATQAKTLESSQLNTAERGVNNSEENKQVSPGHRSTRKKTLKQMKSAIDEDNLSEENESNTEALKSANLPASGDNFDQNQSNNVLKLFKVVRAMKEKFQRVYNRLEFNQHLNNKKALFINMRNYYNYCCDNEDVSNALPLTFHVKDGLTDPQFHKFTKYFRDQLAVCESPRGRTNVWIIKPGENSNRGSGIKVEQDFAKISSLVDSTCSKYGQDGKRTVILQKYIDNPLLYCRRKFDVRCFGLVTCHNGLIKAYFYRDGYIRTASKEFNLHNLANKYIHLVNDAVQQHGDEYGKYETANKLSYQDYQKYLNQTAPELNINLERDLITQIRKIVTDTIRATFHLLDSKKRLNSYELLGYDFMFDDNYKPYLIEVNSNPCLELSSSLLAKIFKAMLDNTVRIACDPLFPPPGEGFASKKSAEGIDLCPENRFDLIFDERIDGPDLLERLNRIDQEHINEVRDLDDITHSEEEEEPETVIITQPELEQISPKAPLETEGPVIIEDIKESSDDDKNQLSGEGSDQFLDDDQD